MRIMVYVIAELRNHRQLARLRAGVAPDIEAGLAAVLGSRAAPVAAVGSGAWMAELGAEESLDAAAASSAAWRVKEYLSARRDDLFGFAVLVASLPAPAAGNLAKVGELLEGAEADEELWLAPECAALFADWLAVARTGRLFRVTGQIGRKAAAEPVRETPRPWIREALVARALDEVSERLNGGASRQVLWVRGPSGIGKTALLMELSARLLGSGARLPVLRLHTIFKRRSALHPFINSLLPSLLGTVPRFLHGPERGVWDEVGGLLGWLQDAAGAGGEARPLPDHILEDFSLGYRLYLLAWTRMAEENFVPAVFICEGIDAYHPAARRIVARLLEDFVALPCFLPLLSSVETTPPDELSAFDLRPLDVYPLGKREIRALGRHLFPGLELPESLARRLKRRSGGMYLSVVSYLQYLLKTGRITAGAEGHRWVQGADGAAILPANPLSVSWYLIRTLHDDTFLLLYALYLAGGLLDRQGLLSFLAAAGFDAPAAERSLSGLLVSGLMTEEGSLIPRFPALRRKLEELLGAEGAGLRERFISHIFALWRSGKYRHPVLLFTFLARNGRNDLALRILPDILRRKLDENDIAGARAFCDPRGRGLVSAPTHEQGRVLAALTALGRLRASLLEMDAAAAEAAQADAERCVTADLPWSLRAEIQVERAKCFLAAGSAVAALDELKKALLLYQEAREDPAEPAAAERGERSCYLWLGATMLAEGRLREAVEYLGLSQRLSHEAGEAAGELWAIVYLADCLFIDGRFTQCLASVEEGLRTARAIYRRDIELFLTFLQARALFQIGSYEECSLSLQTCLCCATLYSVEQAFPVLRAWLGRALIHLGDLESGTRMLESVPQTRESLLALAEGSLFSGSLENASLYTERALAIQETPRFPSPEGISWWDGHENVEGRCFRLARGGAALRRSLVALRAYLLGLRGMGEEAISELHRLTRGEKAEEIDPEAYRLNYLYSRVLPETGSEDLDDKVTVLSKALKSLQERASRIEAPAQRSSFLWRNRWNRLIMEEARERKLV
jgi:tetratricopeptide (TPR) repeat protein